MRNRTNLPAGASRLITTSILACAVAVAATACGSPASSSSPSAQGSTHHPMAKHSGHMTHSHAMSHSMSHTMSARLGAECGMVPATGMGSFHGMSMDPVITAAAHNPLLTTFAAEIRKAGLVTELNSARNITVFAPDNSAFAKLHGTAMSMLDNSASLAEILKYHVVARHVTPDQFASAKELKTLQGGTIKAAKMGAVYEINTADVTCGNIATANATIYIINTVLEPMHMH